MRFLIKAAGLLLILVLPVLIYVFLQAFGENKYDIPVYYENGVDTLVAGCNYTSEQYKVPARYFPSKPGHSADNIHIAFFKPSGIDLAEPVIAELARAMNVFKDKDVRLLLLSTQEQAQFEQLQGKVAAYGNDSSQWAFFASSKDDFLSNIVCDFVIPGPGPAEQAVFPLLLIDKKRRIRGYFQPGEREEIDRLVVEINILLENDEVDK